MDFAGSAQNTAPRARVPIPIPTIFLPLSFRQSVPSESLTTHTRPPGAIPAPVLISIAAGQTQLSFDTYLDNRAVIPNAEVAVKLAKALGTTLEFLVTGEDALNPEQKLYSDFETYRKYKKLVNELDKLSPELLKSIEPMIHSAAEFNTKK